MRRYGRRNPRPHLTANPRDNHRDGFQEAPRPTTTAKQIANGLLLAFFRIALIIIVISFFGGFIAGFITD